MLDNRIREVFQRIGLQEIPPNNDASLDHIGLDSLMLALFILELELEFKVKMPVMPLIKERYATIASIEQHLLELGAK